MTLEEKYELLAKFFANQKFITDPQIDKIEDLHDDWNAIYRAFRITDSFEYAKLVANKEIIKKVLSEDYN